MMFFFSTRHYTTSQKLAALWENSVTFVTKVESNSEVCLGCSRKMMMSKMSVEWDEEWRSPELFY